MLVAGRWLPPDLPQLLSAGDGPGGWSDGCTRVGRVDVVQRLLGVPVCDTRALLRLPRETWFGERGKCFVAGCAGLRDDLDAHLRARFGVQLGDLAQAPARGPPGAGRSPTMAERAADRRRHRDAIDTTFTVVPEDPLP